VYFTAVIMREQGEAAHGKRVIRASEVGDYGYCSRAWWYRHVARIEPADRETLRRLQAGTQAHRRHGRSVALSGVLSTVGLVLALLGALLLLAVFARAALGG
jgi:CRISPR/Cas system-associated exonuclease Cas4 (RecB family)